ncbi:MAG: flippase-like domain-containing protein [Bacteroidales bacterium]|nr:flippase-like domain-containing protein [Bacteroidales bacterium]
MNKKVKKTLTTVLCLAIAVVLLYFSFRAVEWNAFVDALEHCRWGWVILSMVAGALVIVVRGLRWRMQMLPLDPDATLGASFNAYSIGLASCLVLPRMGDIVRCGYLTRSTNISFDKSIGTMVVDRVWDIVSMLLIGVALVVLFWSHFGGFIVDNYLGAVVYSWTLWIILAAVILLLAALLWLLWKKRERGGFWTKAWGFVQGIGDGLVSCLKMRHGWLFILYTILIWAGYWFMSWSVIIALQDVEAFASLGPVDALFLMFAGSVSAIIPVPGGFGAYHGVVAGAISAVWGIPFATGMVYAILSHESQVIVQAVLGVGSYVYESFFRK